MKKTYATAFVLVCLATGLMAQKESDRLPDKPRVDSLFRSMPPSNQLFQQFNPGATIINRSSRGTIYNMPQDNMAVLVPDMQQVENMPGSNPYKPAPRSKMPNPLYPPEKKSGKH